MLPSFRSSPRYHQRRRLLVVTLLFVGLCFLVNVYHLGFYSSAPIRKHELQHQARSSPHVLPPELIEFVQNGGFDDSEKVLLVETNAVVDRPAETSLLDRTLTIVPNAQVIQTISSNETPLDERESSPNPEKPHRKKQRYHHIEKNNQAQLVHNEQEQLQEHRKKQRYHKPKADKQLEGQPHRKKQRYHKPKVEKHDGFPPLDRLVNNQDKITGSVDWLLDFAILGHAKCATTYLMNWLRQHESIQMHDREVCDLNNRQPASLVRKLYTELAPGEDYLRGYKCPGHFSREPLRYFRQYFKNTKLIVGLRHPVRWFESYYNYRIRHPRGGTMPPPQTLLGKCVHESQGVCTDRANFHRNLAMLAKTNHSETAQRKLLVGLHPKYQVEMSEISNPVFLYDLGQLYDRNIERKAQFQADFEDFVGLDTPLPSNYTEPSSSKGDTKFTKIDICHSDYDEIRRELVNIASRASTWITEYFIRSDSVFVSSPEYFVEILQTWHYDPCVKSPV